MKFQRTTAINKLLKLNKRVRVVQGGTSAGKTFGILPILINVAATHPDKEISVISESIPHLRRGALKDFLNIMKYTGRYFESRYNKSLLTYNFANGSFIEFFSADQPDKLRGARRDIVYINEANNILWESYHHISIRTNEVIWLDFNPTQEFWAHTELMNDSDTDYIILTYKDNEALNPAIRADIEKARDKAATSEYWANWWKVYGLGQIGNIQGVIFTNYTIIDVLPDNAKLLGYGMDFGYAAHPTALIAVYKHDGKLIYHEIIYETGLLFSELVDRMKSIGVSKSVLITADSADPRGIEEISRSGYKIRPVKKGVDSITFGIDIMQRENFAVTKESTNLIKEFRSYMWEMDKTGKSLGLPQDKNNHGIDAIRYYHLSSSIPVNNYSSPLTKFKQLKEH